MLMLVQGHPNFITLPSYSDYNVTLEMMNQYVDNIIQGSMNETIFLLEHNQVYTAGSTASETDIINATDIPIIYTQRGGKFTYHGPGQRVIYPLLNLANIKRTKDIKLYVRNLESWIINVLMELGVKAYIINGLVGIWIDSKNGPAKIAAIGVRVKKWVTYHGIAINISTDLTKFNGIIPCGISNFSVTSLKELGIEISLNEFDQLLKQQFRKFF